MNKLFSLLQRPTLWQRSSKPFWNDEHISKSMLEAHLNPDWDAASRKHSYEEAVRSKGRPIKDIMSGLNVIHSSDSKQ